MEYWDYLNVLRLNYENKINLLFKILIKLLILLFFYYIILIYYKTLQKYRQTHFKLVFKNSKLKKL